MVRQATRSRLLLAAVAGSLAATPAVPPGPTDTPALMLSARIAEVWILPKAVDPSAVLLADDLLYVSLPETRTVLALDQDGRTRGQLAFRHPVLAAAFDPGRRLVYVTSPSKPGIHVIQATDVEVLAHIDLPHAYLWMTVADGLAFANVSRQPSIDVIDLESRKILNSISVSGVPLRTVHVGSRLYVSSGKMASETEWEVLPAKVDVVDLAKQEVLKTLTVPGAYPAAMAWDGDRFVYVAPNEHGRLMRIDTTTDELDPGFEIEIDGRPYDIVVDGHRQLIYLSCTGVEGHLSLVSLEARREIGTLWAGGGFMAFHKQPDGAISRLWVPNVDCHLIAVIDPADVLGN